MTSNDDFITVEMFNARMDRLEAMNEKNMVIIDGKLTEIRSEIKVTNSRIDSTNTRIDNMAERIEDLKFFGTVGLAIITIFIAIVALVPMFRKEKSERRDELSQHNIRDIRALIREEIRMAQNVAVVGK